MISFPPIPRVSQARLSAIILAVVAWPLFPWYLARLHDEASEPLGLLALSAATMMIWANRSSVSLRREPLAVGAAIVLVLRCFGLASFPMIMGLLVVGIMSAAMRSFRGKPGVVVLLTLSLPLMESLDFFGGYPLRLSAAEIARAALNTLGMEVMRAGALLRDGMNLVGVDPPCAGIRMLWTSWFVGALLAARLGLRATRTMVLLTLGTVLAVCGNSLRAVILFFPESGRVSWPHWTHEATGLAVHGLVLWALFAVAHHLADLRLRAPFRMAPRATRVLRATAAAAAFIALGALTFTTSSTAAATEAEPLPDWPATLDGVALQPEPLTAREQRFAAGFPGQVARFRCGPDHVILRRVTRATRRLHAAAECLQASGWSVQHQPLADDGDGRLWGAFTAQDGTHPWLVRERIVSADGRCAFTDPSAWIWDALLHPEHGPWLAITVLSPVEEQGIEAPRHQGIEAPRHQGIKASRHQGIEASRHRGTKAQRHKGI